MWKVWHGNLYGASIALNCFYDGVDIHIMISEKDSSRSTRLEQVRERLTEFWSYLIANQSRLINYGREYLRGRRISTARVESTVDQLVDSRIEKKQHMTGAQMLPPRALCADQRRTGQIHPGGRPQIHRWSRPRRHDPPDSFQSRFKYSATTGICPVGTGIMTEQSKEPDARPASPVL
jgi:hypothetical protein